MNQLRKIAQWFWLNKERMVLTIMVGTLLYRVYGIVQPSEETSVVLPTPPGDVPPTDVIGDPPPEPPMPSPEDWTSLYDRSMFTYVPTGAQGASGSSADAEIQITLVDIQERNGNYVARIQTTGRPRSLEVGGKFEQFEIVSIDPERGCCEIFVEALGRSIERCIPNGAN